MRHSACCERTKVKRHGRPPLWLMRQAGRDLPKNWALRAEEKDSTTLCTTPGLATEVALRAIRRYRLDAAILFTDILMVPWALGQGLAFCEGDGPVLPPLRDAAGVAALRPLHVLDRVGPILETARRVRLGLVEEGFGNTALIAFAGSPVAVTCYMVEGVGSRAFAVTCYLAFSDPGLLDILVDATVSCLSAQIDAGAGVVMLFDSWAGGLSPGQFRNHVVRPTRAIMQALGQRYPTIPAIGIPRLVGVLMNDYGQATGVPARVWIPVQISRLPDP